MKTLRKTPHILGSMVIGLFATLGGVAASETEATKVTEPDPFADTGENLEPGISKTKYDGSEELAEIVLFSAADAPKAGLKIEILEPVVWTSDTQATFTYRITNCLDDEVFVQVQDLHKVGTNYKGPEGSAGAGIGSGVEWPDNRILLKRLRSAGFSCSTVDVKASTNVPFFASHKGKMSVSIWVSGFFRSTGKQFIELIDLPFAARNKTMAQPIKPPPQTDENPATSTTISPP